MGGHRNDRNVATLLCLHSTNLLGSLVAVHFGHVHVHQNDVKGLRLPQRQRFAAVIGNSQHVPLFAQHDTGQALIDHVVLGQQDAQAKPTLRGQQAVFTQTVAGDQRFSIDWLAQRGHDGVQQIRLRHRLGQVSCQAQLTATLGVTALTLRGDHHDGYGSGLALLDFLRQLETIHARHLHVQQCQRVRLSRRLGTLELGHRLRTTGHGCGLHAPVAQHLEHQFAVAFIVVCHQHR